MTVQFAFDPPQPDPLGVLSSTAPVVEAAQSSGLVRLDVDAMLRFAHAHAGDPAPEPEEANLHATALPPRLFCNYLLLLEALNFSFWDQEPRWRVPYRGARYDGYWALVAALHRGLNEDGTPLCDARWMAGLERGGLDRLLRGEGRPPPLMAERLIHVREAGEVLLRRWDGEFANLIEVCQGDAVRLAQGIAAEFRSFRDEADWRGQRVRFYKRAQIGAADLSRLLPHERLGRLHGLKDLTAFADYKVPQVMRREGLLVFAPDLTRRLEAREQVPAGGAEEVAIRAATIWGCEWLARALAGERGRPTRPMDVDYLLWCAGQDKTGLPPYHLTRTIYY
jgi:hypothetical protein